MQRSQSLLGKSVVLVASILLLIGSYSAFFSLATTDHQSRGHAATVIKNVPIVAIGYYPPDASNKTILDAHITGKNQTQFPYTIQQWETITQNEAAQIASYAGKGTIYHGYKDPAAIQYANFSILAFRPYLAAEPLSTVAAWDPGALFPDYNTILTNNNVCNYVDVQGVKEIWIFAYQPSPSFPGSAQPQESILSSKEGDIANSISEGGQYNPPKCTNSYTVYTLDYGMEYVGNSLHDRIHQIENIISYLDYDKEISHWPVCFNPSNISNCGADNATNGIFWGGFSQYIQTGSINNSSCGNAHYTPNWSSVTLDQYNYGNTTYKPSYCETWSPDKTKLVSKSMNCQEWGCTDIGFYVWYMQNMPGFSNGLMLNGLQMRNWWDSIIDFDGFLTSGGRKLFEPISIQTPSITKSITTTPTLTPTQISTVKLTPISLTITKVLITPLVRSTTQSIIASLTPTIIPAKPLQITQAPVIPSNQLNNTSGSNGVLSNVSNWVSSLTTKTTPMVTESMTSSSHSLTTVPLIVSMQTNTSMTGWLFLFGVCTLLLGIGGVLWVIKKQK